MAIGGRCLNCQTIYGIVRIGGSFQINCCRFSHNLGELGRCTDNFGNGKEYNGEPYYNYIKYDESEIHENDIIVTGFILNRYGECEERLFDIVVLKNTEEERG